MASLGEVARRAAVSRSTVSRVVNGQPGVSPETRRRVQQAIQELKYSPHSVARSLATRKTRIISFVMPEPMKRLFSDYYYPLLLQGAVQAATTRGYQVMLTLCEDVTRSAEMAGRTFVNGYAEGVVVAVSVPFSDVLIPELIASGFPFVCIGRWPGESVSFVDVDNVGAARSATAHLLRLGYRRIGTITGPPKFSVTQERLQGYESALKEYGVLLEPGLIAEGDFTEAGGMAAMHRLLSGSPDAVFVQSDTMAVGATRALRQAGLRIPEDIALVGFDDLPLASLMEPPLTTIRQPVHLMGFMAVDILLGGLEDPAQARGARQLIFPTELVIRESCGALRRGKE